MKHTSTGAVALLLCLLVLGVYPSQAQLIHENPTDITPLSAYGIDKGTAPSTDELFVALGGIITALYDGDYDASREALKNLQTTYGGYSDIKKMYGLSDEQTQMITDRLNLTSDDLQAMINDSEAYDRDYSDFNAYMEASDSGNAASAAARLQSYYTNISSTARNITDNSAFIQSRLSGANVDTTGSEDFLAALSDYTAKIASDNQRPSAMVDGSRLMLSCDQAEAGSGDNLSLTARLFAANHPATGRVIDFYADNVKIGRVSTDLSGLCLFNYTVGASYRDPMRVSASLSPQDELPALTSNIVEVKRKPEAASLQINAYPGQVKYGESAEVRGSLATSSGYPVPRRTVGLWLGSLSLGSARTGDDGSFAYPLNIPADVPSGQLPLTARYDQMPGDVIPNATSGAVLLDVLQENTQLSLDPPASSYRSGSAGLFNGTLLTGSGRPVDGGDIGLYANGSLLGNATAGQNGTYSALLSIPADFKGGSVDLYAAYQPGEGRALAGSASQVYVVAIEEGTPGITAWPFAAALSDFRVILLLIGILILAGVLVAAKITGADRIIFRRKPREDAPAQEPTASSPQEIVLPGKHRISDLSSEEDLASLDRFISNGGDSLASLTKIYEALRKLARSHGLSVELSDTPRELARKLCNRDPSLDNPVNALLYYYETAVFGHYPPSGQDVINALFCLREIQSTLAGGKGQ